MFSIIAAIGKNNELGKSNQLLFHIKDDMEFFRETTSGHQVIMGRKLGILFLVNSKTAKT